MNAPSAWEKIADDLSKETLTDIEFDEVATKLEELDAPEAPPGGQVIVIGGPSNRVKFAVGVARSMRAIRPPLLSR